MIRYFIQENDEPALIDGNDNPSIMAYALSKCIDQVDEQGNIIQKATWQEITQVEYEARQLKEVEPDPKTIEIADLKQKLEATDYQAIKFAEGELTASEYEPVKQQRREWRKRINELGG